MSDPTQDHTVSQAEVDPQGRLPVTNRLQHAVHREINSSKNTCGAVPCTSRLPDTRLTVVVLGGETLYGSHIVRGLTNPAYSTAFDVRTLQLSALRQSPDVSSLAQLLRGAHTVILADCCIVQRGGGYVDLSDDKLWQTLLSACERVEVKRFVPSPFEWDLQLARPGKKHLIELPDPIRRASERQQLLTNATGIDYTLISVGILTEQLFSPLAGVDVDGGIVRVPAGLGWQTSITTTTLDDLARMLPEILLSRKSHKAKVNLASATLTYEDVARIIEETTGKSVQRVDGNVNSEQEQAGYRPQPDDALAAFRSLLSTSGGLWWTKGNSWNAGHIPHVVTTPIRLWAAHHLKASNLPAGPPYQPNLHTTHTGLAPIPPSPSEFYFSVATA